MIDYVYGIYNGQRTFKFHATKLWNDLDCSKFKDISSFITFKNN
jgi:hypothetical protein